MAKILITGAKGQLAREFVRVFEKRGIEYIALTKQQLDISKYRDVERAIEEFKPDIVINCAAYNFVDMAEGDGAIDALMVNTVGVYNLIISAQKYRFYLVHFSTDYVFDGEKVGLYTEDDLPNPLNFYGKTKLFGEELIKKNYEKFLILRTSWVYGTGHQNFLFKLQQWIEKQEILRIACDEYSVPTSTITIVELTLKALREELTGLYHLVNSGYASRYEWAQEYLKLKNIKKVIYPAYRHEFNLPAKRPKWSAMSNERISKVLNIDVKHWKEALYDFVNTSE